MHASYSPAAAPDHSAPWQPLRWLVPLLAAYLALNWAVPGLQATGIPNTIARLVIHLAIALGLWLGLERTAMPADRRLIVWLAVMLLLTLWLSVIWSFAITGGFQAGRLAPRLPIAILLPVVILAPILLRSRRVGEVLDATPRHWLVALQVYRVLGGIFLIGWARGAMPGIFSLPAGIGDVATGLLALPVAAMLASGANGGRREAIAWNVFGLLDFAVAVGIGFMISPGPLQVIVPSIPNTFATVYPQVMTPAFVVPCSILLHLLSLRQLRRSRRTAGANLSAGGTVPQPAG